MWGVKKEAKGLEGTEGGKLDDATMPGKRKAENKRANLPEAEEGLGDTVSEVVERVSSTGFEDWGESGRKRRGA